MLIHRLFIAIDFEKLGSFDLRLLINLLQRSPDFLMVYLFVDKLLLHEFGLVLEVLEGVIRGHFLGGWGFGPRLSHSFGEPHGCWYFCGEC